MAVEKKKVIGMVAYHRHSKSRCEMKRLYVKPKYRENKLPFGAVIATKDGEIVATKGAVASAFCQERNFRAC